MFIIKLIQIIFQDIVIDVKGENIIKKLENGRGGRNEI